MIGFLYVAWVLKKNGHPHLSNIVKYSPWGIAELAVEWLLGSR